ncbi:MAG TPA: hypothetical protein VG165_18190 [Solirubrobacteraceae bacterium]|nr:hypothetical protein [Solirubrobacteraceae bacterium]
MSISTPRRAVGCALVAALAAALPLASDAATPGLPSPMAAVPAGAIVLDQFADGPTAPPEQIAAGGGWLAWSHRDPVTGSYQLMLRAPDRKIAPAGVAERALPFDVSIGPTAEGGTAAVYSRCANVSTNTACRIVELALPGDTPTERTIHVPGGGSVHTPALYGDHLAFLRVLPGGGIGHPDAMFVWTFGSAHLQAYKLPRNTFTPAQLKADPSLRATDGQTGQITALSLTGPPLTGPTRVAYTRVANVGDLTTSDMWLQSPGGRPQLIDRVNTGGASSGLRTYLGPTVINRSIYSLRQYSDLGETYVRYSLVDHAAAQAEIALSGLREYRVDSAVPDPAGLAWSVTNSGSRIGGTTLVLLHPNITWQTIPRPHAAHLPAY